jgi:hypothetical protein
VKLIRSWPSQVPEGRCYVADTLPKLVMESYDYRCLESVDDDIVLIEWDVAAGKEDLEAFIDRVRSRPDEVVVAPYRLYMPTRGEQNLPRTVWAHRRYRTVDMATSRFVEEDEPSCHLFGLGLVYLPRDILQAFLASWPGHFSDASFSGWHYRNVTQETPIAWESRPVHLHYRIDQMVTG